MASLENYLADIRAKSSQHFTFQKNLYHSINATSGFATTHVVVSGRHPITF